MFCLFLGTLNISFFKPNCTLKKYSTFTLALKRNIPTGFDKNRFSPFDITRGHRFLLSAQSIRKHSIRVKFTFRVCTGFMSEGYVRFADVNVENSSEKSVCICYKSGFYEIIQTQIILSKI